MCAYVDLANGKCKISKDVCPYTYYCTKVKAYKVSANMPENCSITQSFELPKGAYEVCYESHGFLYVNVNGYIEIIKNPFDFTPPYIKMHKNSKGDWVINEDRRSINGR